MNPYESPQTESPAVPRKSSPTRILILAVASAGFVIWTAFVYSVGYMDGWEQGFGGDANRPAAKGRVLVPDKDHDHWLAQ